MIVRYFPYTLTLRAPAVLTSFGGDPNSSRTLPFIPGASMRGAVARGLGDPAHNAGAEEIFRHLILDGSVRFLNAYPRAGGRRTLPTPISLRSAKNEPPTLMGELQVWDLAAFDGGESEEDTGWPEVSLVPVPDPFISIGAAQPLWVSPVRGSRIHQQRDRKRGRAWTDPQTKEPHGTIFVFEYLEAGQEFEGIVQVRAEDHSVCDDLAERVKAALGNCVLVGRSRRGGYGGDAAISWRNAQDREVSGQGIIESDVPEGAEFRALLTSAYLGRDPETGQLDPIYLASEIVNGLSGRAEVIRRRWSFEPVGGFNRKWRLAVPQGLTCAAGSVVVLKARQQIPLADLRALENAGLGERRVEGFGRVAFFEAPVPKIVLRAVPPAKAQPQVGKPPDLVLFAEARIVQEAIRRVVQEEALRMARTAKSPPSASLLSRLRNAMRAKPDEALGTIRKWLAADGPSGSRLKRPAMSQLERCHIGKGQRLSVWLSERASQDPDQELSDILRLDALAQRAHVVSEASARGVLKGREAAIRASLIEALLAALSRRKRSS